MTYGLLGLVFGGGIQTVLLETFTIEQALLAGAVVYGGIAHIIGPLVGLPLLLGVRRVLA